MDQLTVEILGGTQAGIRVLRLVGPFTLNNLFDFQTIVREGNDPVIILDMTDVPYIDSAALGALVGVHTFCQRQKRQYALVGVAARVRVLFEVAGVEKVLVTFGTLEEAEVDLRRRKSG